METQEKTAPPDALTFLGRLTARDRIVLACTGLMLVYFFFIRVYYPGLSGIGYSVFGWLWHAWNTDPDSQHGMFVPLIAAGFLWWKKDAIFAETPTGQPLFLPLIFLGCLGYILGLGGGLKFLAPLSFVLLLAGTIGFVGGTRIFKLVLFPLAFLLFMIPWSLIDNGILTFELRLMMTKMVVPLLNLIGVETIRVGTALKSAAVPMAGLPVGAKFALEVDGPCSGIRSLFALCMITAIYSYLTMPTLAKKWILFLTAVPVAVIGNMVRIMMLTVGTYLFGVEWAVGVGDKISFFHSFSGFMVYISALLILMGLGAVIDLDFAAWLRKMSPSRTQPKAPAP
ncbi:MAG: exosortase/archaeosortase family protein [Verrucomicrobiae bacterium]|nr:exosortase/archaeosortase family protein [Verrucomicrobiae bacterium]